MITDVDCYEPDFMTDLSQGRFHGETSVGPDKDCPSVDTKTDTLHCVRILSNESQPAGTFLQATSYVGVELPDSVRGELLHFLCTYYNQLFLLCSIGSAVYRRAHNLRPAQSQQLMDTLQLRSIPDHKKHSCGREYTTLWR